MTRAGVSSPAWPDGRAVAHILQPTRDQQEDAMLSGTEMALFAVIALGLTVPFLFLVRGMMQGPDS